MRRAAAPTSNASLREIVSRNEEKRRPGAKVIVFFLIGARRHKKGPHEGRCLSCISFEDVHDGLCRPGINAVDAERCADAMHMLVRRRSSLGPASSHGRFPPLETTP